MNVDGVLLVDKEKDWTSHDVCAFVRKRYQIKKVGHAGTLDPLATGLLVLLLGKGTKQSGQLSLQDKIYSGVMQLGLETDSHDLSGKVIEEKPWESITLDDVREKAKDFRGDLQQTPPMVSAIKKKGTPLYKLARKGISVEREPRSIRVERFEIEKKEGALVSITTHVSKGTYVRVLVHDLGQTLGCGATLADLRRIKSGPYHIDHAVTIADLRKMTPEDLSKKVIPLSEISHHENLQVH